MQQPFTRLFHNAVTKRLATFFAFIALLATPAAAQNYDFAAPTYRQSSWIQSSVLYYKILSDSTVEVTSGPEKPKGGLVIPNTVEFNGRTYTVIGIGNNAFYGCDELTWCPLGWNDSLRYIGRRPRRS